LFPYTTLFRSDRQAVGADGIARARRTVGLLDDLDGAGLARLRQRALHRCDLVRRVATEYGQAVAERMELQRRLAFRDLRLGCGDARFAEILPVLKPS